ncbi:ATP-binding protein [Azospirillum rugosum]|uniref:Signal transduction histidine kinase n=1 Tax=Azospirillum rugosum TaxID=416170 RepID=A0ABS4SWX6_9PROT|nr:ATP-binding protein [Azospirillum rugosum]MBP2297062.1 signal transduction histidine kinase [Azospirillum rugosum]MDQ0530856.1 signal transduction histidine kinase [Azospirillum rugosum]
MHFPRAEPASRKALHADIRNSRLRSTESKKLLIDLTPLGRMVCNLVENAIKHTDRSGMLIACREANGCLEIAVTDTGHGTPAEHLTWIEEECKRLRNAALSGMR